MENHQIEYVRKWYPHFGIQLVANDLDLSRNQVKHKVNCLGLKRVNSKDRICYSCRKQNVYKNYYHCNDCRLKILALQRKNHIIKSPLEYRLKNIFSRIRNEEKDTDITVEFLLQLWRKQAGICHYTGRPMIPYSDFNDRARPDSVSVDKIDCTKGYFKNNVVLCNWWSNCSKGRLSEQEFVFRCSELVEFQNKRKYENKRH